MNSKSARIWIKPAIRKVTKGAGQNEDGTSSLAAKMKAVLLSWKAGAMGHSEATPVRMKTPTGFHFIGFSTQEVGAHYLRMLGLSSKVYDFTYLVSLLQSASSQEKKEKQIVFFRSEQDVNLHLKDRSQFPYSEFQLLLHELEQSD